MKSLYDPETKHLPVRRNLNAHTSRASARQARAGTAIPKSLGAADNTFHVTKPLFVATAPQQQWYQLETRGRATISELWDAA
jgi:hypothetical protein